MTCLCYRRCVTERTSGTWRRRLKVCHDVSVLQAVCCGEDARYAASEIEGLT